MPDIFLSYNREDQAIARRYADALTREGFEVWWDVGLKTGEAYDEVTENALRAAKAVVVLWSKKSVASRWVRAEATLADRAKTLAPVMIEPCERPIMFELVQTADLTSWNGDPEHPVWKTFVADLHKRVETDGVVREPRPDASAPAMIRHGLSRRTMMVAGGAAGAVALGAGAWALWPKKKAGAATLAVLPFDNLSADEANAFLADGIAEEVLNGLQRVHGLRVIARTSSFSLREEKLGTKEIGQKLSAELLVQGSVRQAGKEVRVAAQLVDAQSGEQMWSQTFQKTSEELFALQDDVTAALVKELQRFVSIRAPAISGVARPTDPESFRNMLKARELWSLSSNFAQRGRYDEADAQQQQAINLLDAEIAKNPMNAEALALLGSIWVLSNSRIVTANGRRAAYEKGRAYLARATAADPNGVGGANLQAEIFSRFEYRWKEAEQLLLGVIERNPSFADAHTQLAYHYAKVGRQIEALPHAEIGVQLDPLTLNRSYSVPRMFTALGREAEAIATFEKLAFAGSEPNFIAARDLYFIMVDKRDSAAIREIVRKVQSGPRATTARGVQFTRMMATADAIDGRPEQHRAIVKEMLAGPRERLFHAEVLWAATVETAAAGDVEFALDLFEICYEQEMLYTPQWYPFGHAVSEAIADHPRWKTLWSADPRLKALVDLRLDALRRRQFYGRLPDGKMVRPQT